MPRWVTTPLISSTNSLSPYQVINTMTQYTHVDPSTPGYVVSNTLKNSPYRKFERPS